MQHSGRNAATAPIVSPATNTAPYTTSLKQAEPVTFREKVIAFYRVHNPQKITSGELNSILFRYTGKEEQLLKQLYKQYSIPYEQ